METSDQTPLVGKSRMSEYRIWWAMKHQAKALNREFCPEWEVFERFLADVGMRPSLHYRLIRIDKSKGFERSNMRWIERAQQHREIFQPAELESEIWKPIPGYEGLYSASSLGRIRKDAVIMKPSINEDFGRYMSLGLSKNGEKISWRAHRLIALAFIGPPSSPDIEVNHEDGCKTNNRPSNLTYMTRQENQLHAQRTGLLPTGDRSGLRKHPERAPMGERNNHAVLKEHQVVEIIFRAGRGELQCDLAEEYKLSDGHISNIVSRRIWKHLAPPDMDDPELASRFPIPEKRAKRLTPEHGTRFRGVWFQKQKHYTYAARLYVNNVKYWLGTFQTQEEAADAYDLAAVHRPLS